MSNELIIRPRNLQEAMDYSNILAKSNFVPTNMKDKPGDILVAIQMGAELGLPPLQSLQNIAVINGKPSVYGDAALAVVLNHPACEEIKEWIEGDGDNMVALCSIKRRGHDIHIARFSVEDAKKAKLLNKVGPWQDYRSRMLQMRARGFALRDKFPDALKGLILREEAMDYPVDVTPQVTQSNLTKTQSIIEETQADVISLDQVIFINDMLDSNKDNEQFIFKTLNITKLEDIPKEKYENIIKWLKGMNKTDVKDSNSKVA